jgi:hypothetical protein
VNFKNLNYDKLKLKFQLKYGTLEPDSQLPVEIPIENPLSDFRLDTSPDGDGFLLFGSVKCPIPDFFTHFGIPVAIPKSNYGLPTTSLDPYFLYPSSSIYLK